MKGESKHVGDFVLWILLLVHLLVCFITVLKSHL